MNYIQHFVEKFGRTTFVGFCIGLLVAYLKPELQNTILLMYGILGGKNAVEVYRGKGSNDGNTKGSGENNK
jgi:hypothetical protein